MMKQFSSKILPILIIALLIGVTIDLSYGVIDEPIRPVEKIEGLDPNIVELGKKLFHDPILSRSGSISCASCHDVKNGGDDGKRVSIGVNGALGELNSPSVLNAALNFRQFWDGRAETLEEQVHFPITNKKEMGSSWKLIIERIGKKPEYLSQFAKIFKTGLKDRNIVRALVDYQKSLVGPSRFDLYLLGDESAVTERELRGYKKFKSNGCVSCHQGKGIGGNMYQRLGLVNDYFSDRGRVVASDFGRFNITKDEADKFLFKVPSLRNVSETSPYFHDGKTKSLEKAIEKMAYYQLGRSLSKEDIADIAVFLRSLKTIRKSSAAQVRTGK